MKTLVVDRDGTLASVAWVAPATRDSAEWRRYNAAMIFDAPVPSVVAVVSHWRARNPHGQVVMVSGRAAGDFLGDVSRYHQMVAWVRKHNIPVDRILMRRGGDMRPDSVVKQEILDRFLTDGVDIDYVIDDRPQVIDMWRANGLRVAAVTDPNIQPAILRSTTN